MFFNEEADKTGMKNEAPDELLRFHIESVIGK